MVREARDCAFDQDGLVPLPGEPERLDRMEDQGVDPLSFEFDVAHGLPFARPKLSWRERTAIKMPSCHRHGGER
jgi:hypothetical protein